MSALRPQFPTDPSAPAETPGLDEETYAELRRLAHRRMSAKGLDITLQPTALVHEAWLRLSGRESPWRDKNHFLAGAITAMRHIQVDRARRKARLKHGGGFDRSHTKPVDELPQPDASERLLLIEEALCALEKVNAQGAQIVVARFYGGLSTKETAELLGISERGVDRHWSAAKVWLFRWMEKEAAV